MPDINIDHILLLTFLRDVDNFQKQTESKPDFEKSFHAWGQKQKQREMFKDVDISTERLRRLYEEIIGKKFDENESQNYLINPNNTGTIINEISQKHSDLRELVIVSEIERYWKEGKSIFVVFGSGHLIIQRPALEKILK